MGSTGRAPRIDDVAARAGVSVGTVSNVLNKPFRVSERTQDKVRAAIAELGFVPDRRARALAAGTSRTIGFVAYDLENSFFLDMVRGAAQEAEKQEMTLLIADAHNDLEQELVYLSLFEEERVAGILLAPLPSRSDDHAAPGRWSRDVVVLNSTPGPEMCCVTTDNEVGGYLAARHLIESGRKRLAFAGGPLSLTPVHDRRRGAQRAVREARGEVTLTHLHTRGVQVDEGRKAGAQLAALPPAERPDGVVAAADLVALGLIQYLTAETDIRVPDDLSVVGYDNNRAAWDSPVMITTVDQCGEDLGRAGASLLLREIAGREGHVHEHMVLEPRLVVRQSSQLS